MTSQITSSRRVLIAPDSFKGSLSASEVAEAIADGWRQVNPRDDVRTLPLADGGEGTIDAIANHMPSAVRQHVVEVSGPDGRAVDCEWLLLPDRTALVELAASSGLPLLDELAPLTASSRGLGEVVRAALNAGVEQVIIALGGSASTDGGAGALSALGAKMLDPSGNPLADGGAALVSISEVDWSGLVEPPKRGITLLSDVDAPLLGPRGAASVFGPQKGATPEDVRVLDSGLEQYARLLGGAPGTPGAGAAGGTAYGFATILDGRITSGANWVFDHIELDNAVRWADIVITGEGHLDDQSLRGKVVGNLIERAAAANRQVVSIVGQTSLKSDLPVVSLAHLSGTVKAAMSDPARWLRAAGEVSGGATNG